MKIGIIGTGAMASLFAARLAPLATVTLYGTWSAQIEAINRNGLTLIDLDDNSTTHTVAASDDWDSAESVDIALVLTKSHQTQSSIDRAHAILAPYAAVVTMQNGLGNLEQFADEFGADRASVAVTTMGAVIEQPGIVRQTGDGLIYLAQPTRLIKRLGAILAYMRGAGLNVKVVANADSALWGKAAINAGINPLTAILRVPNGYLTQDTPAQQLMVLAASEAEQVATALGIDLPYPDAAQEAYNVASLTATNRSSMLQDIERGFPTEIDAICGEIARQGRINQIATPINLALLNAVKAIEQGQQVDPTTLFGLSA